MKTFISKPAEIKRQWYIIDASSATLGIVASTAANLLIGKSKTSYTPHVDGGDFVIIINSESLKVSGNKIDDKIYYRHSGFPGGIKSRTLGEQMIKDSNTVINKAVRGMLPVNKLRDARLSRLKIYAQAEHNHLAQKPVEFSLKGVK